jgi:photosystem II stability/assembly factor-like uncharacterized protein
MLLASILFSLILPTSFADGPSLVLDDWGQNKITSMATDSKGALYVVGLKKFDEEARLLIRKSEDGGTTWKTSFGARENEIAFAVAVPEVKIDSQDRVYVFFSAVSNESGENRSWQSLMSDDGGKTWVSREILQRISTGDYPIHTTFSENGNIFGAGNYIDQNGQLFRVLIQSEDRGQTWKVLQEIFGEQKPVRSVFSRGSFVGAYFQSQTGYNLMWSPDNGETWSESSTFQQNEKFIMGTASLSIDEQGYIYISGSVFLNPNETSLVVKKTLIAGHPEGEWNTIQSYSEGVDTAVVAAPGAMKFDRNGNTVLGLTVFRNTEFGVKSYSVIRQGDRNIDSYDHFPNAAPEALSMTSCINFVFGLNNDLFVASSRHDFYRNIFVPMSMVRKVNFTTF